MCFGALFAMYSIYLRTVFTTLSLDRVAFGLNYKQILPKIYPTILFPRTIMTKRTRTTKRNNSVESSDEYTPESSAESTVKTDQVEPAPKRYRLRSGAASGHTDENKENPAKNAVSVKEKPKPKPKSGPKPFIEYKGAVEYYTSADDIEAACAKLL